MNDGDKHLESRYYGPSGLCSLPRQKQARMSSTQTEPTWWGRKTRSCSCCSKEKQLDCQGYGFTFSLKYLLRITKPLAWVTKICLEPFLTHSTKSALGWLLYFGCHISYMGHLEQPQQKTHLNQAWLGSHPDEWISLWVKWEVVWKSLGEESKVVF